MRYFISTILMVARLRGSAHLTQYGQAVGTPTYMAPEQFLGIEVDGRADLYALGIILYELLTERLPFSGPSVAGVYAAILTQEPRRPRSVSALSIRS